MFDTNILVYAFDVESREKHEVCKKLVEKVFAGEDKGAITNQIAGELFHALTKKASHNISVEDAYDIVEKFIDSDKWLKVNYSAGTIKRAMTLSKNNKMHFWDAVITETMKEYGIAKIITENSKDFRETGVAVLNPFE